MNSINPMQLIQLLRQGNNPQQLVMNIIKQRGVNNPILNNALQLAQQGNTGALEQIARNLSQQRGLDYDTEIANFRKYF